MGQGRPKGFDISGAQTVGREQFDEIGARVSADRIRRGILEPDAEVAKGYEQFAGTMPKTFGQQLTGQQLEAIVRFLAARR